MQASQSDDDLDSNHSAENYEYEKKEVSVNSSIFYELVQMFTYETHAYKGIEYGSLYKNYETQILTMINKALDQSKLSEDEQYFSDMYTIVGENQIEEYEPLHDRLKARSELVHLIAQYIDSNEKSVRDVCVGPVLKEHTSKVVWAPHCCDLQIHKHCFLQCKDKGITKCMNSFCSNPIWNKAFYAQVCKQRKAVSVASLYDADCPLCLEPLKAVLKKNDENQSVDNNKNNLIINKDGIVPGAKKIRFL